MDTREEQLRADFLDFLYDKYGRTDGLYTALWQQYLSDVGMQLREDVIEGRIKLECGYAQTKKLSS